MLFTSLSYLPFLALALCLYYISPAKVQRFILPCASLLFAFMLDVRLLFGLLFCTILSYSGALCVERVKALLPRKFLTILFSLLLLLPLLSVKAGDIFPVCSSSSVFLFSQKLLTPVGLSFYTFITLGYLLDVYHCKITAEPSLLNYIRFATFFPQLVSGPIVRKGKDHSGFTTKHSFQFENLQNGTALILMGYFEKLWIADRINLVVSELFSHWYEASGWQLLLAAVLYGFQIYTDFNGYSLIAIGSARCFGIALPVNFQQPYFAVSVRDFWKRWHITLTTWFRDFIYIPLSGNRVGPIRRYFNILLVFLISGIWHGTSLTFLIWGLLHGVFQIAEILFARKKKNRTGFFSRLFTFMLIDFAWLFFRMNSVKTVLKILQRILFHFTSRSFPCTFSLPQWIILLTGFVFLAITDLFHEKGQSVLKVIAGNHLWLRGAIIMVFALLIIIFGLWGTTYNASAFIYFRF